jgi:hypothetical protein
MEVSTLFALMLTGQMITVYTVWLVMLLNGLHLLSTKTLTLLFMTLNPDIRYDAEAVRTGSDETQSYQRRFMERYWLLYRKRNSPLGVWRFS